MYTVWSLDVGGSVNVMIEKMPDRIDVLFPPRHVQPEKHIVAG
jgi:hypothetical protein